MSWSLFVSTFVVVDKIVIEFAYCVYYLEESDEVGVLDADLEQLHVRVLPERQYLLEVVVEAQHVDLARDARQVNAVLAELAEVGERLGLVELLLLEQLLDHLGA